MKVALINAPTSHEQIYGDWDLSSLDTYTPPLGLLHIAGFLKQSNHQPFILDLMAKGWNLDRGVRHILAQEPDAVGLSAMTINCLNANKVARELKSRGLTVPVILGGAHVTAVPKETLETLESIDYAVLGEGEVTFLELLQRLDAGQPVEDVQGVAWRDETGKVVINPPRPPIQDLDMLPFPAWELLPGFPESYPSSLLESKRLPAAGIMTSRGCPYHCTFCDHRVFGSKLRHFSAEYTLSLIRHLVQNYGIKDLMILDDNFLINKKKLFEVCDGLIGEKLDLTWYCIAHVQSISPDRMAKIKRAGCWFIEVGIESGNDEILKQIKKNTNKAEIRKAVRMIKEAGIKVKGNFIFGFPGETPETLEETIDFALELNLDYFQQSYLTIWPGCEMADRVPGDAKDREGSWGKLAHQRITFVPEGMTKEELLQASRAAFRRFYLRPRTIINLLPTFTTPRGIRFALTALVVFIKTIFRRK